MKKYGLSDRLIDFAVAAIRISEKLPRSFALKIISKMDWFEKDIVSLELSECNELISIFVRSIATAQKNKEASV